MKKLSLVFVSLCFAACAASAIVVNGHKLAREDWNDATTKIRNVASFEMHCDSQLIQLALVSTRPAEPLSWPAYEYPEQVGATGCGQERVYTHFHGQQGQWVSSAPTASSN